ncbi:hypothetical protein NK553_14120 [Pseudomonas sp. ZM23]|uniref:DUF4258 domain-containing protein n=1 Tax=Pseudomonas triclosanedens TaxID=2961893 RepID=A0ABY7A4E4_9PSED|nr:hypothetical protein [Pseudomonas triclosanedens]MCP8465085.1 hypothetical protein [Pseudomonas triclosanedens]MCP8470203.1 hypothetical protein [Pseudomonas triclosanedens]MCP8476008.1 hypothetical protein [Pseudomonas triclosanedens]WAI51755.1 hypothetical protein OU419_11050 [Pseudomonas triclosanedens]
MEFSAHAIQRCNQRAIRQQQVQWIVEFGCHTWNRGARVHYFDRSHFQRLLLGLSPTERQLAEKARNAYVVVKGGVIITVGRRHAVFCTSKPGSHRRIDWRHGEQRAA